MCFMACHMFTSTPVAAKWRLFGKEGILHLPLGKTRRHIAAFTLLQMSHLFYLKGACDSRFHRRLPVTTKLLHDSKSRKRISSLNIFICGNLFHNVVRRSQNNDLSLSTAKSSHQSFPIAAMLWLLACVSGGYPYMAHVSLLAHCCPCCCCWCAYWALNLSHPQTDSIQPLVDMQHLFLRTCTTKIIKRVVKSKYIFNLTGQNMCKQICFVNDHKWQLRGL